MKHADAAITGDTDLHALEIMFAEGRLNAANSRLAQALGRNEALAAALVEARSQIASLRDEIEKLCAPPSTYGVYLSSNSDGTLDVLAHGRKVKVTVRPGLTRQSLRPGQEVVLNEGLNVIDAGGYDTHGDVVTLKEVLDHERVVVTLRADEERVALIADPLRGTRLKSGDRLLMETQSGYLLEQLPKSDVELSESLPWVNGDRVQLQQVLLNLTTNAMESMVTTDGARALAVTSEIDASGRVLVSVKDTGTGIAPAAVDRIFAPLFTTKSHAMGMGLSICRSIIEAHDGRLWSAPNAPSGSVFHFVL